MAITFARVQSKTADADPGAVTLDLTPIEGNLLVAHATERSGGDAANFTIDGVGWTRQVAETTLQGDANARRTHVVFWKVVGAAESRLVSVDDGTANTKRILVEEYEAGAVVAWVFQASTAANTGTDSTSPLASGSTASTSGTQLLVGSGIWRNGTGDPGAVAFSGLGAVVTAPGGSNGRTAASAFVQSTVTGTKSTSLSWTGAGHEANVALLVFSATEGDVTNVVPSDTAHGHTADQPALIQVHQLSPASAAHGHTAEAPTLGQVHDLVVSRATHSQSADQPALTSAHVVIVADAVHDHVADQATFTQAHQVVTSDAAHTHGSGEPVLTQVHVVDVDDAGHTQTSDVAAVTLPGAEIPGERTVTVPAERRVVTPTGYPRPVVPS